MNERIKNLFRTMNGITKIVAENLDNITAAEYLKVDTLKDAVREAYPILRKIVALEEGEISENATSENNDDDTNN